MKSDLRPISRSLARPRSLSLSLSPRVFHVTMILSIFEDKSAIGRGETSLWNFIARSAAISLRPWAPCPFAHRGANSAKQILFSASSAAAVVPNRVVAWRRGK